MPVREHPVANDNILCLHQVTKGLQQKDVSVNENDKYQITTTYFFQMHFVTDSLQT